VADIGRRRKGKQQADKVALKPPPYAPIVFQAQRALPASAAVLGTFGGKSAV